MEKSPERKKKGDGHEKSNHSHLIGEKAEEGTHHLAYRL
jgi:hypothetical protein